MLGTVALLDGPNATTTSTKAREQGVALQREIVEAARSIPYDQLSPTASSRAIQAPPALGVGLQPRHAGLDDPPPRLHLRGHRSASARSTTRATASGPRRRQFCATGAGDTTPRQCPTPGRRRQRSRAPRRRRRRPRRRRLRPGPATSTARSTASSRRAATSARSACASPGHADPNPDDYKRIVTLVRWDRGPGRRYALQSTHRPNPGLSAAPAGRRTLTTSASHDPITSGTAILVLRDDVAAPATRRWLRRRHPEGTATGSGTAWNFTWNLGTVSGGDPQRRRGARRQLRRRRQGVRLLRRLREHHGPDAAPQPRAIPYAPRASRPAATATPWTSSGAQQGARPRGLPRLPRADDGARSAKVCDADSGRPLPGHQPAERPVRCPTTSVAVDKDPPGALREGDASASTR